MYMMLSEMYIYIYTYMYSVPVQIPIPILDIWDHVLVSINRNTIPLFLDEVNNVSH